jgi:hypothetical protein
MKTIVVGLLSAALALPAQWGAQADVLHEMKPCLTYRAKLDGDTLIIEAAIQPGWHTFAIDNERRAAEKRAGKPSLGSINLLRSSWRAGAGGGAVVPDCAQGFFEAGDAVVQLGL